MRQVKINLLAVYLFENITWETCRNSTSYKGIYSTVEWTEMSIYKNIVVLLLCGKYKRNKNWSFKILNLGFKFWDYIRVFTPRIRSVWNVYLTRCIPTSNFTVGLYHKASAGSMLWFKCLCHVLLLSLIMQNSIVNSLLMSLFIFISKLISALTS